MENENINIFATDANETSDLERTEDNSLGRDLVQQQSPAAENENGHEFATDANESDNEIEDENHFSGAWSNSFRSSINDDADPFHDEYDDQDKSFAPSDDESDGTIDSGIEHMINWQIGEKQFNDASNNALQPNDPNQIGVPSTSGKAITALNQRNAHQIGEHQINGGSNNAQKPNDRNQIGENQFDEASNEAHNQSDESNQNNIVSTSAKIKKPCVTWKPEPSKIFLDVELLRRNRS